MEDFDCVVVGAGWYGLAAARQFHYTQPDCSLAVFDSQSSLGGTWADERLYPGLKCNNLLGTYEYPGFPMSSDRFNVKCGEHMSGEAINSYLKAYARHNGIDNLIHLNTKTKKVFEKRLILATRLTSEPFLPHFDGQEVFGGRIFHGKHFQQNSDTLKTAEAVTVFGAGKLAWDAACAYATAGVKVNWVIRSSGRGPCWIAPPCVTPLKKWMEKLANVRFLSWFSPCIWGDADGYPKIRNFYHGTAIGRFIVDSFWKALGDDVMTLNKYDAHPERAKLKPWTEAMFTGASFSILNYEQDIMELVKSDLIDVHIGEVDHLSPSKVHLADGTDTGWKHVPPIKLLPKGIEKELGIPHRLADDSTAEDLANQRHLIERADKEILQRFPRLQRQPVWNRNYKPLTEQQGIDSEDEATPRAQLTPYMLYHFLVPPSPRFLRNRDIAFAGMISNFSNAVAAHVSGLWISAYFSGKLTIDPSATVDDEAALRKLQYETVLFNRWGKWRYPTDWGNKNPNFVFDLVPYLDLLQRDLGLNPYRKKGWFAEITDPYGPEDYQDINDEWLRKQKYE
ncbi:FAD/NAD(P)-binding domain-containing protein [Xylariaceae sp. AK1471]|nr:FAD/NAD(P)-binding domain-containing protein [Xylariaceae sp. AK1471]